MAFSPPNTATFSFDALFRDVTAMAFGRAYRRRAHFDPERRRAHFDPERRRTDGPVW